MAVGKDQVSRDARSMCKRCHMVNDRRRNGKFRKISTFDDKARDKAEKNICALDIPRGAKADGRNTARLHGVTASVMILVNFAVRTKHSPTMVLVVKATTEDYFTGAIACATIGRRKVVEPHDHKM